MAKKKKKKDTHSRALGYFLWIFGFMGAHRFYYGKKLSGTLWFFTFGLCGIGWIVDLFLIPSMENEAAHRFVEGPISYSWSWIWLTYLGMFGVHRFYMGKFISGIVYLLTVGLFGIGWLYDYWTLNEQVSELNAK
jgi:TM2 domain-containing membrane protein YozV